MFVNRFVGTPIGRMVFAALLLAGVGRAWSSTAEGGEPKPAEMAPLATQAQINDLAAAGPAMVAVGERGIILRSDDGVEWTQVPSPIDSMLNAVYFVDDDHGWAVGHDASILGTTDGGATWTVQAYGPRGSDPFMDVFFTDQRQGYAIGAYGLFRNTADGGKTWTDLADPALSERAAHMNAMLRLGDGSFALVGEAGLVATSPDAHAWSVLAEPYEGSLYAAVTVGAHGLLAVGMRGNAFEAADLREPQWQVVATGTDKSLFGLAQLNETRVVAAGSGGALLVLEPGRDPVPLPAPVEAGMEQSTIYTALLFWKGQLYAATDRGVHRIAVPGGGGGSPR